MTIWRNGHTNAKNLAAWLCERKLSVPTEKSKIIDKRRKAGDETYDIPVTKDPKNFNILQPTKMVCFKTGLFLWDPFLNEGKLNNSRLHYKSR